MPRALGQPFWKLGSESNFSDLSSFGTTTFSYDALSRRTRGMGSGLLLAHLWSEGRGRGRLGLTGGVPIITVQRKHIQATLGVAAWVISS